MVAEYVGDGGGSAKPWPVAVPPPDAAEAVGGLLSFGARGIDSTVAKKQTNWFRLPANASTKPIVVLLQPTADEDSDLYVMRGNAQNWPGSDACLGYSNRTPTGGADPLPTYGVAPDWVAFAPGDTSGWPAGQIAVYGMEGGSATKHFWVEADVVDTLTVNGGAFAHSVDGGMSRWYKFAATAGKQYTVRLGNPLSGTPDCFVYGNKSTKFKAQHSGIGDAIFTATETSTHYVRVWGEAPGANNYAVLVRQP
jgi:hypothetical protein